MIDLQAGQAVEKMGSTVGTAADEATKVLADTTKMVRSNIQQASNRYTSSILTAFSGLLEYLYIHFLEADPGYFFKGAPPNFCIYISFLILSPNKLLYLFQLLPINFY